MDLALPSRRLTLAARCFAGFMVLLLAGYALFGKGFAYVGVPPVFIGEVGLLLGLATLPAEFSRPLWQSYVTWLLIGFMGWGAVCTFPCIGEYGIDALRDGALWGYALYALAVASLVLRFNLVDEIVDLYGKAVPVFLVVICAVQLLQMFAGDSIPRWPWGPSEGVPIIQVKPGDLAVHLAGVFAFVMIGVATLPFQQTWMFLWILAAAPPLLLGRGSFLTITAVAGLAALLRPTAKFFFIVCAAVACLFLAYAAQFEVDLNLSNRRVFSVDQLVNNLASIVSPGDTSELSGTKKWREVWWATIVDYTVFGEHFWTGKGFGVNLADEDGFQVNADRSLRNPHNVHMTVLARAGVPGIVLWSALQLSFAGLLLAKFFRDKRAGRQRLASVEIWVLLYWFAFLINGTFDVALEGPQGGIWFWSLFGFGLALIVAPRTKVMAPAPQRAAARRTLPVSPKRHGPEPFAPRSSMR